MGADSGPILKGTSQAIFDCFYWNGLLFFKKELFARNRNRLNVLHLPHHIIQILQNPFLPHQLCRRDGAPFILCESISRYSSRYGFNSKNLIMTLVSKST